MSNAKELIKLIREVVKVELSKTVKPLIKEMIQAEVNAVLAERFIATLSNRSLVTEEHEPAPTQQRPKLSAPSPVRKSELLKKLGVEENDSMMKMIYEDVSEQAPAVSMTLPDGSYVDADDEGIDISSLFGGD
jgi:hypothetical protein